MGDLEVPEEDPEALEKALESYRQSKTASRKQKPTKIANSEKEFVTPFNVRSPQGISFTIEESVPVGGEGSIPLQSKSEIEGTKGDTGAGEGQVRARGNGSDERGRDAEEGQGGAGENNSEQEK